MAIETLTRDLHIGNLHDIEYKAGKSALGMFRDVQDEGYYNKNTGRWAKGLEKDGRPIDAQDDLSIQLLSIFTEAQFSPETAKNKYDILKQTPSYDKFNKQWRRIGRDSVYRYVIDQLYG